MTALVVYVDDIIMSGNNLDKIEALKKHLMKEFENKDLKGLNIYWESKLHIWKKEF